MAQQASNAGGRRDVESVLRENQMLKHLLELGDIAEPDLMLREALRVACTSVGAVKGYLALFAKDMSAGDLPRWFTAVGYADQDLEGVHRKVSRSIIHEALETRRALLIASAMGDNRFGVRESVQSNRILSVLCAPVGTEGRGILYLQEKAGGGIFDKHHEAFILDFGRHLSPLVDRMLLRSQGGSGGDATRRWRTEGRFDTMVGATESLARCFELVTRYADIEGPVLLEGHQGTGKSMLAAELHKQSQRRDGPFIHVPCAALPHSEAFVELFGRVGDVGRPGFVEIAEEGTLFLDGVEALPLDAQAGLLSLVEDGSYRSLGDPTVRRANVRVVASTALELEALRASGTFRSELYHRLSVLRVPVPSLADRSQDIPLLMDHFGRAFAAKHRVPWRGVDPDASRQAMQRAWLGNVRELAKVVERAVLECDGRRPIRADDLDAGGDTVTSEVGTDGGWLHLNLGDELPEWRDALADFKRTYLLMALERFEFNKQQTANHLGLSKSRIFALINETGLRDEIGD